MNAGPIQAKGWWFQELGPNQTARDLFGHLQPGEKVAIISRFLEGTQDYVGALEARGLQVRVVTGQSGVEDFCFLMNTKKESIGIVMSTFFFWAGLLGNCAKVIMYSVDGKEADPDLHNSHNWTHPELKQRIHFEDFMLERES